MGDLLYRGRRDVERWLPDDCAGGSNQCASWGATRGHHGGQDRCTKGASTGAYRGSSG
jgi:hypothetical protein